MKKDTSWLRRVLRRAESAEDDPAAQESLQADGIYLGEEELVDKEALLAELEGAGEDDGGPSITVTVSFEDTPVDDRSEIEEPLARFVEESGLGEWVGSGQGAIGEERFFDVTFAVEDLAAALPRIRRRLRELGAGPATRLDASDGSSTKL